MSRFFSYHFVINAIVACCHVVAFTDPSECIRSVGVVGIVIIHACMTAAVEELVCQSKFQTSPVVGVVIRSA